ncbi:hypothetical protein I552_8399 [Mycobacterium xenopi 3993]|nr:hypothetical protein I552_8399 [Mycobacterium xenopi 3993]
MCGGVAVVVGMGARLVAAGGEVARGCGHGGSSEFVDNSRS